MLNVDSGIQRTKTDYTDFLNTIKIISEEYPFKVHSICLMSNHFHMAVETGTTELWRIMQKILSIYAGEFNHRHGYSGHLFESRYTAKLIEDEQYFLEVQESTVQEICDLMGRVPPWTPGLILRADGYECPGFYMKD